MPARGRWITLGLSSSSGGLGVAVNLWGFSLTPGLSCPSPPQSPRSQNCLFFFFQGKSIREFSSRRLSSQKPLVSKTWQTRDGGADSFPRGCHNRFLQTGWLQITETYSLLVWRPGAWNQGIRRVGSFWSSEGESVQHPSSLLAVLSNNLSVPWSAAALHRSLCLCLHRGLFHLFSGASLLIGTPVILGPVWPHLN